MNSQESFPKSYLFLPLLVAVFLYTAGLTSTDLWTPDEPRYAEVAREMIERGDYLQPYCNGKPYTEKPPLFFWTIVAGAKVFGEVDQLTVRLPSVLSALGTLALLIVFINEFLGRKAAFLSGIFLSTSPQFFWLARSGHIDMLLTLLMCASLLSFYRWHARGGWGYLVVFYGCLLLGTLAKGPVGMILPLMVALCFLLLRKEWMMMKRMRLYIGLPIAVAAVLAWYIPAALRLDGYSITALFHRQIIGRTFHAVDHSVSVFYWPFFHFVVLAWGMAPWSLLIPWAVFAAYRARRDAPQSFLLCWAGVVFVFFTLIASKREIYILPMFPAAAALIGLWVARSAPSLSIKPIRMVAAVYGAVLVVVAIGAIALAPTVIGRKYPDVLFDFDNSLLPVWAGAGVVAMAAAFFGKKTGHVIGACVGSALITFVVMITSILPWVDEYKSPRDICNVYTSARSRDSDIAIFRGMREEFAFYTKSVIKALKNKEELKEFFDTNKSMFCFVRETDFRKFLDAPDFPLHVVAKERVSSRVMVLLSNRPAPSPQTKMPAPPGD